MTEVFSSPYADAYDLVYHDKDYAGECDLIERILHRYGDGHTSSLLDLGSGTGNHAFPLSSRGYDVVGVERSPAMLTRAAQRLETSRSNGHLRFLSGDIRDVDVGRVFDGALMMFAVLGYQLENEDVLRALRTARRHVRTNGLLLFDVWYGPAVLHQRPSERFKVIPTPEGELLRFAAGELRPLQHACSVSFHLWRLSGDRVLGETEENHTMRYFFPLELSLFLESTGFRLLHLGAFPDLDQPPDETTWNVIAVARAS
jgi:SAM-dependent methyltransferase